MNQDDEQFIEKYFKRPVAYWASLAKATGSVKLAVLLSQLWYWRDKGHDPDGWVYKTRESIYDETGLSRQEQETARKLGRELGILREIKKRIPPIIHFQIDVSALANLLKEHDAGDEPLNRRKSPRLNRGYRFHNKAGDQPIIYTESTTETKTKTTQKNTASAERRRRFAKKFFKQAKEWITSSYKKTGSELENVINWVNKNYDKEDGVRELRHFVEHWTQSGRLGYGEDPDTILWESQNSFAIFERLKAWLERSEINARDP